MTQPDAVRTSSEVAQSDSSSGAATAHKSFTNKKVSVVLDEYNFLVWKQQVLLAVRSLRLEKLLTGALKPPPATVTAADGSVVENEDHEIFVAQDSALASWLLSTISPPLLPQFVGAETAAAIWSTVLRFFASRSTTTVMSLHYRLRSIKKGDMSMRAYVSQIKELSSFNSLPDISSSLNVAQASVASFETDHEKASKVTRPYRQSAGGGRGRSGRMKLQCQLCGKLGHLVDRCWHRFDENFVPITARSKNAIKSEIESSATIPLVQGAEKLWRNVHAPCNTIVPGVNSDNARQVVQDDSLNESSCEARGQSENLVRMSDGSNLSLPSAAEDRSSSMDSEMSPARSMSSSMADAPGSCDPLMKGTLQEVPVTTVTNTQPMLQDVPVTLAPESTRTDTERLNVMCYEELVSGKGKK
ncbi:hypothetical protein GQ457_17G022290 [Hibiscus cannabinus]